MYNYHLSSKKYLEKVSVLIIIVKKERKKKKPQALEGGLEPPTLWLTATRSNQLSYSSYLLAFTIILF